MKPLDELELLAWKYAYKWLKPWVWALLIVAVGLLVYRAVKT
jgi:hypothetical protein